MSYLGGCRDCGKSVYWADVTKADGTPGRAPFDEPSHENLHWVTCAANVYVTDVLGNTYRVTRCSKCRRSVYWETTARGKKRPMDVWLEPGQDGQDTPHAAGECHFETCTGQPTGDNWRQREYDRSRREGYERTRQQQQQQRTKTQQYQVDPAHLATLQLTWPVSLAEITSAFRQHALRCHPDMGGSDAAFIRVKAAYDALKAVVK